VDRIGFYCEGLTSSNLCLSRVNMHRGAIILGGEGQHVMARSAYLINGDDIQFIKCLSKQNIIVKKRAQ
jgi:hypothetical protein